MDDSIAIIRILFLKFVIKAKMPSCGSRGATRGHVGSSAAESRVCIIVCLLWLLLFPVPPPPFSMAVRAPRSRPAGTETHDVTG